MRVRMSVCESECEREICGERMREDACVGV